MTCILNLFFSFLVSDKEMKEKGDYCHLSTDFRHQSAMTGAIGTIDDCSMWDLRLLCHLLYLKWFNINVICCFIWTAFSDENIEWNKVETRDSTLRTINDVIQLQKKNVKRELARFTRYCRPHWDIFSSPDQFVRDYCQSPHDMIC